MWVKICGITTEEDALYAVAMGADALGFVFAAGSTRQIAAGRVAEIVRRLPPDVLTFGVFRDELADRVIQVVERAGLNGAQLHGHETPETVAAVRSRVPCVIRAFAAGAPGLSAARKLQADAILLDAPQPGSGKVFDWTLAKSLPSGLRVVLAGGLRADNVAAAIEAVRPWGVDVSSGVEAAPGVKDPRRVRAFIQAAKAAGVTHGLIDDTFSPEAMEQSSEDNPEPFDWDLD
jgi:phosphoribosylanthranilate isomerase